MNEILLTTLVTSLCSGGLTWLFTFKYTRKQAEADSMLSVQSVYQQMIDDLKNDRVELKDKIENLKERDDQKERDIRDLTEKVKVNEREIQAMKPNLCGRKACVERIPIN